MNHIFQEFGIHVFDEKKMKERLPHPIYQKWKTTVKKEDALDQVSADAIAHAMKMWAMEHGVTHYSHWFQPLNGLTAKKQDCFLEPNENGQAIARFSGKTLMKGEGDASSFPNGGLRATFEARGYTYWDCTSFAFIKDQVLYIPTIFVSYNGEVLDRKTPLLRSIECLSTHATRILNCLGFESITRVTPMVGLEQEYFLIDKSVFEKRKDLIQCGRTLFGKMAPKGDVISDHYFGSIPSRVEAFMKEVNESLWKLGIYAKTQHNEVAPCQFEIAPLFCNANLAVDQNLIIMDILKTTANQHGFACLLHEKPFSFVNGSGKHNNYSLVSDDGYNLFDPGENPSENIRFLIFTCALIKAVDTHSDLLYMASSSYSNDYRLGGAEAPPAIISICMGDHLETLLLDLGKKNLKIKQQKSSNFQMHTFKEIPKDTSDRNRTSPFAFTGNKFEFRMLGSSLSASSINIVLNTILADALCEIYQQLMQCPTTMDIQTHAFDICQDLISKHQNILFSKDGYSKEWKIEAKKRNLYQTDAYVYSIQSYIADKNIQLFERNQIYQSSELHAHVKILFEEVIHNIKTEVQVLLKITKQHFLPKVTKELHFYHQTSYHTICNIQYEKLSSLLSELSQAYESLKSLFENEPIHSSIEAKAYYYHQVLVKQMHQLRFFIDEVEEELSFDNYPFPTYEEIFTSIY